MLLLEFWLHVSHFSYWAYFGGKAVYVEKVEEEVSMKSF